MLTLTPQFKDAIRNVSVDDKTERAQRAHQEVRGLLERNATLKGWGVDTVLIGSYARHTAIFPGRDVDVFTKLTELDTSSSPQAVFDVVCKVVTDEYGDRAEPRARSIKVSFGADDFSVDVVPAVRSGSRWALPRHDRDRWQDAGSAWVDTDPERLTTLTQQMNDRYQVSGRGAYVPVVRLMRQVRRHHLGREVKPGGLYFEMLSYWTFDAGVAGDSFAALFAQALNGASTRLGSEVLDPALGTPYAPQPDLADLRNASRKFDALAADASRALRTEDECEAAALWRGILGSNDRGACFPLPRGCDERGQRIQVIERNPNVGTTEARPFA